MGKGVRGETGEGEREMGEEQGQGPGAAERELGES